MAAETRTTLADVARDASVSLMTASNAINNRPGVSESTRKRVIEIANRLGYVPNMAARGLAGGRTHMIGVLINDLTVQWATEVVTGVAEVLSKDGLELLISATYRDSSREAARIALLGQGLVDGLVLVSPVLDPRTIELVAGLKAPVVVVDPRRFDTPVPHVTVANYDGARAGVEHLLNLGHRRIAIVGGDDSFDSARERLRGYHDAITGFGLSVIPELVLPGDYTQASARQETEEMLSHASRPTAIFATSDVAAMGVIDAARSIGMRVPEELSIVGFDDIPSSATMFPALTTVRAPLREMGRAGAEMLLALLADPNDSMPSQVLPTELIERESAVPVEIAQSHPIARSGMTTNQEVQSGELLTGGS